MRLLGSDPKPKPKPKPGSDPPNSASSSSTAAVQPPRKRTRDLPNLFDCHCCGRHINRDNPKDRPQALDSVWRIVLLCKKCRKSIHSGEICSYCFRETGNSDDFCQCSVCERRIHKDCVRGYGDCSPWCYSGAGLEGFGVCVDCWVPELLRNSIRVCRNGHKRRRKNKAEGKHLLMKDADCVKMVGNVKQEMKNAEFENGGLYSFGEKDKDGENSDSVAIEVEELANRSCGAMNGSPRILSNYGSMDALKTVGLNGFAYEELGLGRDGDKGRKFGKCGSDTDDEGMERHVGNVNALCPNSSELNKGLLLYNRDRKRKIWEKIDKNGVVSEDNHQKAMFSLRIDDLRASRAMRYDGYMSEGLIEVAADRSNICTQFDRYGQEILSYKRRRKVCQVNGSQDVSECSSDVNGLCKDYSRLNVELLCYKRDKKRKTWLVNDKNTVASEAGHQKGMFDLHLDDDGIRGSTKSNDVSEGLINVNEERKVRHVNVSIDVSEGSSGVNGQYNDINGLNQGLLTYTRDRRRKKWQLNDENTVVPEASQQEVTLNLHLDHARTKDPVMTSADLSQGSFDVNTDQSDLCTNFDRFGHELLCYERSRFRQKECGVNVSIEVNGPCNDGNGLSPGLLTCKRDRIWKRWQLYDGSSGV